MVGRVAQREQILVLEAVTARGYVFVGKVKEQDQPGMMIYGVSFWRHQLYGRVRA